MKMRLASAFFTLLTLFSIAKGAVHAAPPSGFQTTQIIGSGLTMPTGLGIAPDGRIFILQQGGAVRIYKNNQLLSTPFVTISVNPTGGDLGLLGIAFDPDFNTNHYVYFYYTSSDSHQKIVRYDATTDVAPNTPHIIYETPGEAQFYHAGGTIAFGPDGKIYFSNGDNGYPPNAQDLSNPFGKILRINKDGSIPSDNPFIGQSGRMPEIWAYGLRNPFRFQFDSQSGKLYLGDVGQQTWEEINIIAKGANYGWPDCEGNCSVAGTSNPTHTYNHNNLSSSVTGGLVYRGSMFPSAYLGRYFFADYAQGFIDTLTLDQNGNSTGAFSFDPSAGSVVDLKTAPDGSLYYVTIFPGRVYRVTHSTSNQTPIANSSADVTQGTSPLVVNFSSAGSFDPDGTAITYLWQFGDGTTSTSASPQKTYSANGTYTVNLTVSDGTNQATAAPLTIRVGTPPTLQIITPESSLIYEAGQTISYSSTAQNSDGASLPDSAFTTEILFHHGTHTHPFLGPLVGSRVGQFTISSSGETATDTYYEIKVTATDANGLSSVRTVNINPRIVNITLATNPAGQKVIVDSQQIQTPATIQSVAGFKRELNVPPMQPVGNLYYQFDTWSDGGPQKHFYTTPSTGSTITANLKQTPPFNASYFNNISLSGSPVLQRTEGMVNYDFANGSPNPVVNPDNFSARWTKQHWFDSGVYRFDTVSDDGVRLYIDNVLILDKWQDQGSTPYSATTSITSGDHEIKFEYYERSGGAIVSLDWDQVSTSVGPTPTITPTPVPSGQQVVSMSLINANTDQVIAGFDPLTPGATLNLSTLPTRNLNIRANTSPATVGSVRFAYDGNSNFGTENNAPYAAASDDNGNYFAWTPAVGAHTLTATPYTSQNATGIIGTPLTLSFTVTDSAGPTPTPTPTPIPTGQSITSFTLINADTNQVISSFDPLTTGTTLNLSTLPTRNLNIRANTSPATVGSVRFAYDGNANFGTENNAPYAAASDNSGDYLPWTPTVGSHSLTATPFSSANATGTTGTPLTLSFTVTDSAGPTPTPIPGGQSVVSYTLINANTDLPIAAFDPIPPGATISLSSLPTNQLNIRANTSPATVGSIRFAYDGNSNFGTENNAPYAAASDDNGNYFPWTPSVGAHTLTATPFSGGNATGTVGTPLTLSFTITN